MPDTAAPLAQLDDGDPATGLLAAAVLREQLTTEVAASHPAPWWTHEHSRSVYSGASRETVADWADNRPDEDPPDYREIAHGDLDTYPLALHIAAEANPQHALAETTLWRAVAQRHRQAEPRPLIPQDYWSPECICGQPWPCQDPVLKAALTAVHAWLEGAGS